MPPNINIIMTQIHRYTDTIESRQRGVECMLQHVILLHVTARASCSMSRIVRHVTPHMLCNHNVIPLYEILIHIIIRFPSLNSLYPLPPSPPHTRTLLLYVTVLGVMQMECAGVRRVCNAGECMEFVSGRPPRSSPRQNTCTPSGQGVE